MIQISVRSDLEATVSAWARVAGDQMPYATAVALTKTAKQGKEEIERQLPSLIDRPTPWTMKGFRLYPATKQKLLAEVDFRAAMGSGTSARDYLSPLVYGGQRKLKAFERSLAGTGLLPTGYGAVPGSAAKLDAYGNMSRGQIVQILSYFKAFGEQGYSANMKDKRRQAMAKGNDRKGIRGVAYFVGRPAHSRLPLGVWQRVSFGAAGTAIKPVLIFVSRPTYRAQLDVPGIAKRVIAENFERNLKQAVDQALRTAIPKQQMTLL